MSLTPEEIEARRFPVTANGYDPLEVERFLAEVAATYRESRRSDADASTSGDRSGLPLGSSARPVGPNESDDAFARLGDEVSEMLRSAGHLADSVRAEAEAEAEVVRARAELEANETRSQAEHRLDQAKRIEIGAQGNADSIIADAERRAEALLRATENDARARAEQITAQAEIEAEQAQRTRQATVDRLHAAKVDVQEAIEKLAGREPLPVLDLTSEAAVVHPPGTPDVDTASVPTGSEATANVPSNTAPPAAAPANPTAPPASNGGATSAPETGEDPLTRMVRAAVVRAVEASAVQADEGPDPH